MASNTKEKLSAFLEWLVTPQNEQEQKLFGEFVDDYIDLKARIPQMSEQELISELNIQLKPFNLSVDSDN